MEFDSKFGPFLDYFSQKSPDFDSSLEIEIKVQTDKEVFIFRTYKMSWAVLITVMLLIRLTTSYTMGCQQEQMEPRKTM